MEVKPKQNISTDSLDKDVSEENLKSLRSISSREEGFQTAADFLAPQSRDLSDEFRERFNSLQDRVNAVSLEPPTYLDACIRLDIDPCSPALPKSAFLADDITVQDRELKFYQVMGISYLVDLDKTRIKSVILADDCGLGKTVTTLYSLWISGKEAAESNPPYRPALVVVPLGLLDLWTEEYSKFFLDKFELLIFHASSATGKTSNRLQHLVRKTSADLAKEFATGGGLDANNPKSATKVVLTSYHTWAARTLYSAIEYPSREDAYEKFFKANMQFKKNAGVTSLQIIVNKGHCLILLFRSSA